MQVLQPLRRDPREPAPTQAYQAIRRAIVRVDAAPGQRLSENDLAARLGVSRTPVREALARLREEGLVVVVPQLGTFVARISVDAVADAQFIREALECAAVRLAAERATPADRAELERVVAGQRVALDDVDAFYTLDDDFHRRICDLSRHATVWPLSQRAKAHLNRCRRLILEGTSQIPDMIAEHERVVAAVSAGDADAAELALRAHLRQVLSHLPAIRAANPDYFEVAGEDDPAAALASPPRPPSPRA